MTATKVSEEHDLDPTQAEATARLRAVIGRLSRRLRPTVAGSGLTPSQISVLFTVVRLGPIGLSELAEVESLNPTMLSRITAQLCDAGLIVRSPRPGTGARPLRKRRPPVGVCASGSTASARRH
jgi:DNA-binding MarR family transcriptional regulator